MRRAAGGIAVLVAASALVPAGSLTAQVLPPAGARSLGLAGLGAAAPTGAEAVAVNPAAAALPGASRFSIAVLPLSAGWNVQPVTLSDLADAGSGEIPRATRELWLQRIQSRGRATGAANGSFTGVAAQVGSFGFQVSSAVHGSMRINEDAAELILFGNAGLNGEPRDMVLDGSELDGAMITTFGLSWAFRLDPAFPGVRRGDPDGGLAVGALLTWSLGHALVLGRDMGSLLEADPLAVTMWFPVVLTDPVSARAGDGVGLSLSAAWSAGPWSLGAVVHDAVNTFRWSEDALSFRPGEAVLEVGSSVSDFANRPFSEAPAELKRVLRSRTPSPRVTLAGAWRATPDLQLFSDASRALGRDMAGRSRDRIGVGAEYGAARRVPVRGGVHVVSGGLRLAAGLGLRMGGVEIGTGAQHRTGSGRGETTVGASVTVGSR